MTTRRQGGKAETRQGRPGTPGAPTTLWVSGPSLDRQMLDYTATEDRLWDARLLAWDILGSLGHIEGLRASRLLTQGEYQRLRAGLRSCSRGRRSAGSARGATRS